ncbi:MULTISPECIES: alpha-mannosidase [Actinomyces]|uniref:Alpha-mannosidase n=1 Tax=Actinomyces respiraculi TaxID=2744574 RepID=A0A7T0LLH5_9ACTO|nr:MULTISPECIES: glycoside hydrolase family 38 C-terminal domain-containing protein [Actinomyces]QPL05956.1 alpha-mannosidase [Actinomyces respiraculi]
MHDNRKLIEERIDELRERLARCVYRSVAPVHATAWRAPGEPVPFEEAHARHEQGDYRQLPAGTWWGPAWSTWWIHLKATAPDDLSPCERDRLELRVDLGFQGDWAGNQSEGMVFTGDGHPVKGLNPMNRTVRLTATPIAERLAAAGSPLIDAQGHVGLYVEAAANPNMGEYMNRPTLDGDVLTCSEEMLWRFGGADLVVRNDDVWHLGLDLDVLDGLMRTLPDHSTHRALLLRALERAADLVDAGGIVEAAGAARQVLAPLVASGANSSAQRFSAVGHAHIDSAWLWPLRETRRKVVRTFANVVALAEEYPDFHFACTSAQHYQWLKEGSPEIFARVRDLIEAGQWHAVGGMWVESDTNLPSGESLVRQLTSGLRWMQRELGVRPRCLWLPDSFGYTGALPQIARLAGMTWFFTQKMSWNQSNVMPHHSFWWEGIDGTRIWTHFPPVDCYDSIVSPEEVVRAERGFKDKGRTPTSLLPFGYGDGGGGPVREMVERIHRFADLEDAPVIRMESPEDFHRSAITYEDEAPVWSGEMYLEFHRGVYTSNHALKQGNRRTEAALGELEWLALEAQRQGATYPHEEIEALWQRTELLQFHDILPGSFTSWVNREARQEYTRLAADIEDLAQRAWSALAGAQDDDGGAQARVTIVNSSPHPRREVIELPAACGSGLRMVSLEGRSAAPLEGVCAAPDHPVSLTRCPQGLVLDNGLVRVLIGDDGNLHRVQDLVEGRDLLLPGQSANRLVMHPDHPSCFDAWELQEHYRHDRLPLDATESIDVVVSSPLRARVRVRRSFGSSRAEQTITLDADSRAVDLALDIDWQERARVLKVDFPLAVRATRSVGEIQFGSIERPLAPNTSWDQARFETSAHRWLLLAEPGYAVALINESSYGHDVSPYGGGPSGPTGGVNARLTLLRSPQAPDPEADRGAHVLRYSLLVGADRARARHAAERLNEPVRQLRGAVELQAPARLEGVAPCSAAVIDTVKTAFDRSGALIVRLHEDAGARSLVDLYLGCKAECLQEVDLLEDPVDEPTQDLPTGPVAAQCPVRLTLHPFQILTLKVTRA